MLWVFIIMELVIRVGAKNNYKRRNCMKKILCLVVMMIIAPSLLADNEKERLILIIPFIWLWQLPPEL